MAARDLFHNAVRTALVKEVRQITDDPLVPRIGGVDLLIALEVDPIIDDVANEEIVQWLP